MTGESILTVSAAVVLLVQILKWAGLRAQVAPAAVLGVSLFACLFWGWSMDLLWSRDLAFDFFAGWISVAAAAAGVFGFVRATPETLTAFKPKP